MLEKIKKLAAEMNLSVTSLEATLGFGNGTIGKWGKVSPTAENLKKVADFLGVSMDELMSDEGGEDDGV